MSLNKPIITASFLVISYKGLSFYNEMQKYKKTNIWKMIDRHQKLKWMKPTFCFVKYKPMLISHGYAIYCLLLYYHSPYDTIVPVITSCMLPVTSGQGQDTSFYFGVVDFTPAGDLDRHVSCLSPGNILLVCTCHMWKRVISGQHRLG